MTFLITIPNPIFLGDNIWRLDLAPQRLRQFGDPKTSEGERSVVIISDFDYSSKKDELTFQMDAILPVNIGTTSTVIAIGSNSSSEVVKQSQLDATPSFGKGDQEFIQLCKEELSQKMCETAELLLAEVRRKHPGELKRGKAKNFSETPDNFWYVIIQNRIDQLSVTVRGSVEHFSGISNLEIKNDRGNTLFKVKSAADVPEAIKLIFHANRK